MSLRAKTATIVLSLTTCLDLSMLLVDFFSEISESVLVTNLTSPSYFIVNCGNKRHWHFDGSLSSQYYPITVKWQSLDNFSHFSFQRMADMSFKIKVDTEQFIAHTDFANS